VRANLAGVRAEAAASWAALEARVDADRPQDSFWGNNFPPVSTRFETLPARAAELDAGLS
jgi:hypothetical protein